MWWHPAGQQGAGPSPWLCQLEVCWAGGLPALEFGQDTGVSQKIISLGQTVPIEFGLL